MKLWKSEYRISNNEYQIMYSVHFIKKDRAKPPARRGCSAYASESEPILRHSKLVILRFCGSLLLMSFHTRCQETEVLDPDTSYETTPKWHSFFPDQTGRCLGQRRRWTLTPSNINARSNIDKKLSISCHLGPKWILYPPTGFPVPNPDYLFPLVLLHWSLLSNYMNGSPPWFRPDPGLHLAAIFREGHDYSRLRSFISPIRTTRRVI